MWNPEPSDSGSEPDWTVGSNLIWSRVWIAVACVLLSLAGLVLSLLFAVPMIVGGLATFLLSTVLGVMLLVAWAAFFRMLLGWVKDEPVDEFWWTTGHQIALGCAVMANILCVLVLPAILLAWHMVRYNRAIDFEQSIRPVDHY